MRFLDVLAILFSFLLTNALSRSTNVTTLEPSKRDFVSSRRNRLPRSLVRRDDETEGFNSSFSVVKNSGVCETTPGVEQISGYVDVGVNMSMVSPSRVRFFFFRGFSMSIALGAHGDEVVGVYCPAEDATGPI